MSIAFERQLKQVADAILERSKLYGSGHIFFERSLFRPNGWNKHDKFAREIPYDMTPGSSWEVAGDGTVDGSRMLLKPRDDEGDA